MLGMRTFTLVLIFGVITVLSKAQSTPVPSLSDSLQKALAQEPVFFGKVSTRNSFVTGVPVRTFGIKGGVNFDDRLSFGMGFHWLERGKNYNFNLESGQQEERELRLSYASAFCEYSFIHRKHWQVTIPVSFGVGRSWELRNPLPELEGFKKTDALNHSTVVLYEPGMIAEYLFLKYFGIGGGVGFRLMLKRNKLIDQQFTAPIWELRFRVRFGELWKDRA